MTQSRTLAKCLFTDKEKRVVVEGMELPSVSENQVKVRTSFSYLSAGTELTMLQMGNVNDIRDVGHDKLGYSLSGTVLEVGSAVAHIAIGDSVACVGQGAFHATEVLVPKNLVIPIPEGCSMRAAAMAAMGCFALEGIRKAEIEFGENVLVVGGGLMGQFVSQYAKGFAGQVLLMERNRDRLKKVPDGVIGLYADDKGWKRIGELTAPVGVEKVLFCLGGDRTEVFDEVKKVMCKSPDGIQQGTLVFCGGATITVSLASSSGNLRILSSAKAGPGYRDAAFESGADYPQGYVKWTVNRNVRAILQAVACGKLHLDNLITHEYAFSDALAAYEKLAEPDTDALAVLLTYE